MNTVFYYTLLVVGGILAVAGIVITLLVIKFVRARQIQNIATGLFFSLAGISLIGLTLLTPSPSFQVNRNREMLNLNPKLIKRLVVSNNDHPDRPLAQIEDEARLAEWGIILKACQIFRPNHPRYEEIYRLVLEYGDTEFRYEVGFDSKQPDTADLTLFQKDQFDAGYYVLGTYQCSGLFNFVSATIK
jgi:hypothetical protein